MLPLPDAVVFDRAAAVRLGWSDAALTRAAAAKKIVRLRRGLFTLPGVDADRATALAAERAIGGAVVSHRSALLLHGLPLVGVRPLYPELTVHPRGTGSAHRALIHRATLHRQDLVVLDGAIATSVARTVVDVARLRPAITAVPAADAALHCGLVTMSRSTTSFCAVGTGPAFDVLTARYGWSTAAPNRRSNRSAGS